MMNHLTSNSKFRPRLAEFTRVYEFPAEEEVVGFITRTSRGHGGLFLTFQEQLFHGLRRGLVAGLLALAEALCVRAVHTVQWCERAK